VSDGTKICTECKHAKPLTEFGRSARSRDGLRYQCLECGRRRAREAYVAAGPAVTITCEDCGARHETRNPRTRYCSGLCRKRAAEKRRTDLAAQRTATGRPCRRCGVAVATRVGHPVCDDCKADKRDAATRERRRTLRKYGITEADWDRMLAAQDGRCAICRTGTPGGRGERWHIDHCHTSSRVRGLLCHNCNVGIGNFKDAPDLLRAAAAYLEAAA
jgi:hypothetical protein